MPLAPRALALAYATTLVLACGARSQLKEPPQLPPAPECDTNEDCPGFGDRCAPVRCIDTDKYADLLPEVPEGTLIPPRVCFAPEVTDCDDGDVCTEDSCD
ncbi:MAG: hypothetical protein FJ096_10355, partial [Deltaproteobacteria bacterium]|nr:hypothetical protein [Deltaproteobacteria bacterium]